MNCIFCKIINGEIPSYKIYEDEFIMPFKGALVGRINAMRIKEIMEVELWN